MVLQQELLGSFTPALQGYIVKYVVRELPRAARSKPTASGGLGPSTLGTVKPCSHSGYRSSRAAKKLRAQGHVLIRYPPITSRAAGRQPPSRSLARPLQLCELEFGCPPQRAAQRLTRASFCSIACLSRAPCYFAANVPARRGPAKRRVRSCGPRASRRGRAQPRCAVTATGFDVRCHGVLAFESERAGSPARAWFGKKALFVTENCS